jgi:lysophospholipase L1-like esterase
VQTGRAALAGLVVLLVLATSAGASAHVGEGRLRVLFVGNSLTAANDLPAVVASLAHGTIDYRTVAPGGVNLEDHWTLTGAREALDDGRWDVVVLQQGPSTLPESAVNLREWTVRWADAIRAHGATPALYEVWPDSAYGVRWSFAALVHNYRAAAQAAHAQFLPAGEAWQAAWRRNPRLGLYGPDGFHPSRLGTTLAALVIAARLTGTPPARIRLPYPAKTAKLLRAAAAEAIS